MAVKYEVTPKDRDTLFGLWIVIVFLLAAAIIWLGYTEAPLFPKSKAVEVPSDIGAHIGTIALIVILEAWGWALGRKYTIEFVPEHSSPDKAKLRKA